MLVVRSEGVMQGVVFYWLWHYKVAAWVLLLAINLINYLNCCNFVESWQ